MAVLTTPHTGSRSSPSAILTGIRWCLPPAAGKSNRVEGICWVCLGACLRSALSISVSREGSTPVHMAELEHCGDILGSGLLTCLCRGACQDRVHRRDRLLQAGRTDVCRP